MDASARHPDYTINSADWIKYRTIMGPPLNFKTAYLQQFSNRENATDFNTRMGISYVSAFAKKSVLDIRNSMMQSFRDITRIGGSTKYQQSVLGENKGVDRKNGSMTAFIVNEVLVELLTMATVGVYVDMPILTTNTRIEKATPYLYTYKAEDILSWSFDDNNQLQALLLRDYSYTTSEDALSNNTETIYRYLYKENGRIRVVLQNEQLEETTQYLEIPEIPFVFFNLSHSVLEDIADHQIAYTNLASSDINYCLKANFPFYTEQNNPLDQALTSNEEDEDNATQEIKLGVSNGRIYPAGMERPGFIHPSSEPIIASMKKQEQIKSEIYELINVSTSTLTGDRSSDREPGLGYVGFVLETGEKQIAKFWAMYEGVQTVATVSYPARYLPEDFATRTKDTEQLLDIYYRIPSDTYKKEVAKLIAYLTIGHKVSRSVLDDIYKEIDTAKALIVDPKITQQNVQFGIAGNELAATLMGYPEGEADRAKEDHQERAAGIAAAQASASLDNAASRGVADMDPNLDSSTKEKIATKTSDTSFDPTPGTRGEGK